MYSNGVGSCPLESTFDVEYILVQTKQYHSWAFGLLFTAHVRTYFTNIWMLIFRPKNVAVARTGMYGTAFGEQGFVSVPVQLLTTMSSQPFHDDTGHRRRHGEQMAQV